MKKYIKFLIPAIALISCGNEGPQAINFNKDQCDHCQMTISDDKYAAELVTEKGRVYKFDDIHCMQNYQKDNADKTQNAKLFVEDFDTKQLITLESATLISGGSLKSPMGGNTAAFSDANKAKDIAAQTGAAFVESGQHSAH